MSDTASKERQALNDMLSLPEVRRIEVARLQPGDVLVLECDAHITPDMAERLNEYMKEVFPEQKRMGSALAALGHDHALMAGSHDRVACLGCDIGQFLI